ncbi:SprT-like family-domain-containing protein [Chlamydoabsidia padenii]|nr:SprT-like family-domain-containing protein [Chlamydoabsidia padenii]
MDIPPISNSTNDDEAFARALQEEEDNLYKQHIRMNALVKADQTLALQLQDELTATSLENDLALARQLQQEDSKDKSHPANASPSVIDDTCLITSPIPPSNDWSNLIPLKRKDIIDLDDDDQDPDLALAKQLQQEEDDKLKLLKVSGSTTTTTSSSSSSTPFSFEGGALCTLDDENDPNPDLHGLFLVFNDIYFSGRLNMVEVKWSKKMTRCAGTCRYQPAAGLCTITLSEALLKFRPRSDMVNTLLHEMIHALLFVTHRIDNHESHGPEFLCEAARINKLAGTNITVYHTFHDEVNHYKTHIWKCNGPCQHKPPFYGIVSRSMNRPPQKADRWFLDHLASCGGTFEKIASPPPKTKKQKKQAKEDDDPMTKKMTDYLLRDD